MNNDYDENEEDWILLERVAPEVYDALDKIDGLFDVCNKIFGERTTFWEGHDNVDLTNKVMIGCQQLMIQEIMASLQEMKEKYEIIRQHEDDWRFGAIEKDQMVFMNTAGDIAKLPCGLYKMIRLHMPIDLDISRVGTNIQFLEKVKVITTIPQSLFLKITEGGIPGVPKGMER